MSTIRKLLCNNGHLRTSVKLLLLVSFLIWLYTVVTVYRGTVYGPKIVQAAIGNKGESGSPHVFQAHAGQQIDMENDVRKYAHLSPAGAKTNETIHKEQKAMDNSIDRNIAHLEHSSYGHCQSSDFRHIHTADRTSLKYFTEAFNMAEEPIKSWLINVNTFCNDAVRIYDNKFGLLRNVKINPRARNNVDNLAKGGEGVEEVKLQRLDKEDYVFQNGFYEIECQDAQAASVVSSNGAYDKLKQLKFVDSFESKQYKTVEKFTIGIVRGDYANLWNHMFELHGVFIMLAVFNKQPEEVSILFLDGHPLCPLDKNWEHIFGPIQRVGRFEEPVVYKNLVWALAENRTPLSKWENPTCPYVEEFRTFVLNQYNIVENAKQLNCKKLTFTFIVRRNQVYHPRNLEGNVQRKIFNEIEVIEILMDRFPGVCIQALLMESIPMRAQLEIISETDVLIGMHGAGMMHTTFLPRHAGVVELFPLLKNDRPIMYEVMSSWRGLTYGSWQNGDPARSFNDRVTIVDTNKIYEEVNAVVHKMCNM